MNDINMEAVEAALRAAPQPGEALSEEDYRASVRAEITQLEERTLTLAATLAGLSLKLDKAMTRQLEDLVRGQVAARCFEQLGVKAEEYASYYNEAVDQVNKMIRERSQTMSAGN